MGKPIPHDPGRTLRSRLLGGGQETTYERALAWLYARQNLGVKLGLDNTRALLEELGNPQHAFDAFHVGGTVGKGSTCYALEACLGEAGHDVGLFTSPHLTSFRERIRIRQRAVSEAEVLAAARRVRDAVESVQRQGHNPTFFECVTAMAFDEFRRQGVRVAVVEVGMGGRLDATNLVQSVATGITRIGLDHTQALGTDLASIATEKAGIIKDGVPVVTTARGSALDVIARTATRHGAKIKVVRAPDEVEETRQNIRFAAEYGGHPELVESSVLGRHQAENIIAALRMLEAVPTYTPGFDEVARALKTLAVPGRLEPVRSDPWTILDGAHNTEAMDACVAFLDRVAPGQETAACVAVLRDKPATAMLERLATRCSRLVLTTAPCPRSLEAAELARACPADIAHEVVPQPEKALRRLLAEGTEPIRLVTGSLFLVGYARGRLTDADQDPDEVMALPRTQ